MAPPLAEKEPTKLAGISDCFCEGVTEAAGKLQQTGLIHYQQGRIAVLERKGLEAPTCECYQVVKIEYDRLLPYVVA
jgi:hypothetical protein